MTDIGAELYEAIKAEFDKTVAQDRYIQALSGRIEAGTVAPKDISLYAQQLGLRLRQAIERLVSADRLPNGQMYYNIAEKILRPSLKTNYELFNAVAAEIQTAVDKKQGIRIAAQQAELPKERIDAVINAASEPGIPEETMLRRMSVPAETITRSFADDFAKANADFRTRAGIEEFIVRRDDGSCCEWCAKLAGKFRYPVEVPDDVWRRHDNCGCTVEHISGGMSTNVHTKQTRQLSEEQRRQIEQQAQTKPKVLTPEEGKRIEEELIAKRVGRLTDGDESGIIKLDKELYPDTLAGVKRGELMSFEDADTGKVNPKFGKQGYSDNCQTCVVVFEARLRGFDVEATPFQMGSMTDTLSKKTNLAWIDPKTRKPPQYIQDKTKLSAKEYLGFIDKTVKQGERYTIEFDWKGKRSGHIVNLDRTDEGLLRIKDNQSDKEYIGEKAVLKYLKRMKYSETIYGYRMPAVPKLLRIDRLIIDPDVAKKVMKARGLL